jgi:hypothetical protein
LKKEEDFICFQKVTLAVSKVRHLPHLPPLRYGHGYELSIKICYADCEHLNIETRNNLKQIFPMSEELINKEM